MLLVIAGSNVFLNKYMKRGISQGLEKEYPASVLSYDEITINVLAGNATIKNLRIKEGIFSMETQEANLKDFSYADYLKNEDITIGRIHLMDPKIVFNRSDTTSGNSGQQGEMEGRKIRVKNFTISGGSVRMIESDTASNILYAAIQNISIGEIVMDKRKEGVILPFNYETIDVKSDSLYYEMNAMHYISGKLLNLKNESLILEDLSIIPKYSKEVFDQRISYEQDWIALKIDEVVFEGLKMQKEGRDLLFKIPTTTIESANLQIYRNKMVQDDTRIKPLYSEMLRELSVKLQLDSVNISKSFIEYQEKVLENRPAAKLSFHNINSSIKNITNRNQESQEFPKTSINASALFMGETNLTMDWEFDVSNEMDQFNVKGSLAEIQAEHINLFLIPAMDVEAEGKIESLYYDFYGNRDHANGNMQLSYRDFKVNLLKDGEYERKSLLSRLANLIIKNDQVNEDVQREDISVKRDKTKSFWNFLWLCIRDGALSTFF